MKQKNELKMLPDILLKHKAYKILSFLSLYPEKSFYDKEISELSGVSRGATNQILKSFLETGLVTRERRGKMWLYRITNRPLFKYFRIFENLVTLSDLVQNISPYAKRIILFGSATSGEDTMESDIDLFIITDKKNDVLEVIRRLESQRKISPVIKTPLEYATEMKKNKVFYSEVSQGIVLHEAKQHE